jgi:hypothetical protein
VIECHGLHNSIVCGFTSKLEKPHGLLQLLGLAAHFFAGGGQLL